MSDDEEYNIDYNDVDGDEPELFIDLSEKEASSKALEPFPTGMYHIRCTDGQLQESKSEKNSGKPMYNLEFTVQGGDHDGRKVWTYACLWAGAAYTIVQIAKALDPNANVEPGQFRVPKLSAIIGSDFMARIVKVAAKVDENGDEKFGPKNEIKSFKEFTGKSPASKGEASLLP